jgi:hypothetical protein
MNYMIAAKVFQRMTGAGAGKKNYTSAGLDWGTAHK